MSDTYLIKTIKGAHAFPSTPTWFEALASAATIAGVNRTAVLITRVEDGQTWTVKVSRGGK